MKTKKRSRGQGLVEFALILPLLLLILLGIFEFGRAFFIYSNLFNAAREGTRYGMTNPRDYMGITRHTEEAITALSTDDVNIWVWYDRGPGDTSQIIDSNQVAVGYRVVVFIQHDLTALTPLLEPFFEGQRLESRAVRTIQTLGTIASTPPPSMPPPPAPGTPAPTATPIGGPATATPLVSQTPTPTADTPTPGLPTATPGALVGTLTPSPSPTPLPIVIYEPIVEGSTVISGSAQPNAALTLRVIQTGETRTLTADANGEFIFEGLSPLLAGYTVVVQGYNTQDSAVVVPPPPTPTPSPTPRLDPYLELDPDCTDENIQTIYVRGYNWPLNNKVKKIAIYWDEVFQDSFRPSSSSFVYQMTVNGVTEGTHTIMAQTEDNQGNFVPEPDGAMDSITFVRPCSTAPTGPTPTPLPDALPDLVIPSLQISEYMTGDLGTYETVRLKASVANQGVADVSSLFWVDLYLDPDLDRPLNEQASVDYVAINGLAADSMIYFTMYVPGENLQITGTHSVVAVADTWEQISESDETNNLSAPLTFTITVQNPVPTPTPTPETPPGDPGGIEGRTYIYIEDQLQSLSGVGIYVYDPEGRLMGSGFSDASGLYQITDLPAGDYTVVGIVRMGDVLYQDQIMVTVWEGATTQGADLVLEPTY
jgi:hypothetical protein